MSIPLSSDDKLILKRECETPSIQLDNELDLESIFEIEKSVKWILELKLLKVCLQFPDSLLIHAPEVAAVLEKRLGSRVYILGDTTYGSCCVDEVNVQHIGGDGVIHYGHTCLTPSQNLPVLNVFTTRHLDITDLINKARDLKSPIALFYDVYYHHLLKDINHPDIHVCYPIASKNQGSNNLCGRFLPDDFNSILYAGNMESFKLMLALTFNEKSLNVYDPETRTLQSSPQSAGKLLMKRYYAIEKAKDAKRIGVLVGTLGASKYKDIVESVQKTIKASKKKCYTFILGKPNPAKCANFPEIDIFVHVACPENSLSINSKEYYAPIITPLELDYALNDNREWATTFSPDFSEVLAEGKLWKEFKPTLGPDVSLVSGKIRDDLEISPSNMSTNLLKSETAILHYNGGGSFLQSRSWKGLEAKLGESNIPDEPVEGRKGIAGGYEGEPL